MSGTPHPNAPGLEAGVTEDLIHTLVHTFYGRVREDEVLGPIFNTRVSDWDEHLEKLCGFWSSVLLMTGRYKGRPMPAHARIAEISPTHFERWLALFAETARDVCPPTAAAMIMDRAERIGASLQAGIAMHRGMSELPSAPR